jgi:hypothetical protein
MIGCVLQGGLGNMMFQIAALEDMGRRSGFDTCYPDLDERLHILMDSASHSESAFEYLKIFRNFNWHKNYDKAHYFRKRFSIPHRYVMIEPEDNSVYTGYFQSERYFDRESTLKLFEPSDMIEYALSKYDFADSCSIHVRRGDYTERYAGTYAILGTEYYQTARDMVKAKRYYLFSDDHAWCRDNFNDEFVFVNEPPQVELFMMSRCTHNIIANSSFSWWGSYLNRNTDKKIIAPSAWYTTTRFSAMDIYCNNWTII